MSRAESPVLGTALLTAITLIIAATVGVVALGVPSPPEPTEPVVISTSADASSGRITVVHESGGMLDVRELTVRIEINGEPLQYQPPVPFFSSRGFVGGPTGAFNSAADPRWELGESVSVRIAGTNAPTLTDGAAVRIVIYRNNLPVASAQTTAR